MKEQGRNNLQDCLSFDVCPCQKPLIVSITVSTMGNLSLPLLHNKEAALGHTGLPTPSNILRSFHGTKFLFFPKQKTSFRNHIEHKEFFGYNNMRPTAWAKTLFIHLPTARSFRWQSGTSNACRLEGLICCSSDISSYALPLFYHH